jgi:hypothetical protein
MKAKAVAVLTLDEREMQEDLDSWARTVALIESRKPRQDRIKDVRTLAASRIAVNLTTKKEEV